MTAARTFYALLTLGGIAVAVSVTLGVLWGEARRMRWANVTGGEE